MGYDKGQAKRCSVSIILFAFLMTKHSPDTSQKGLVFFVSNIRLYGICLIKVLFLHRSEMYTAFRSWYHWYVDAVKIVFCEVLFVFCLD